MNNAILENDLREKMAYWLEVKMDAQFRGDEKTAQFALGEYRKHREARRALWGDPDVRRTA
ncbi:hypothetical protein NYE70_11470 [Paenibacillus sp. FSL R5-0407]|uniref:hypothetical protein n=1 Tax=Paenibacillus sp. FSL R5-0407 TaxID=2975320 RepID=UPI0030F5BBFE